MPVSEAHFHFLESAQNADGGWGYAPERQSWMEPTLYALLALHHRGGRALTRGWQYIRSAQLPSGAWPASLQAPEPHWVTALAVRLHMAIGVEDEGFRRGVGWLLVTSGAENGFAMRVAHWLRPSLVDFNPALNGWPWHPGTSSWVEPTAHTLMALQRARTAIPDRRLPGRIATGERMLLDRRCSDGGWNYGNRRVQNVDLPSYPESTALALLALAGNPAVDQKSALLLAHREFSNTRSRLARAWLALYLGRVQALPPDACPLLAEGQIDILVTALEALAGSPTTL